MRLNRSSISIAAGLTKTTRRASTTPLPTTPTPSGFNANFAEAFNNRGVARTGVAEYDRAIADFTEAIRLNFGDAAAYNNRGVARARKGEHDLLLNCGAVSGWHRLVRTVEDEVQGEYDRAIADYTEAIRLNPGDAAAYNNRGIAWLGKNQFKRACQDFRCHPKR
jgi:tetratricopeptide (TPR) repeat protein